MSDYNSQFTGSQIDEAVSAINTLSHASIDIQDFGLDELIVNSKVGPYSITDEQFNQLRYFLGAGILRTNMLIVSDYPEEQIHQVSALLNGMRFVKEGVSELIAFNGIYHDSNVSLRIDINAIYYYDEETYSIEGECVTENNVVLVEIDDPRPSRDATRPILPDYQYRLLSSDNSIVVSMSNEVYYKVYSDGYIMSFCSGIVPSIGGRMNYNIIVVYSDQTYEILNESDKLLPPSNDEDCGKFLLVNEYGDPEWRKPSENENDVIIVDFGTHNLPNDTFEITEEQLSQISSNQPVIAKIVASGLEFWLIKTISQEASIVFDVIASGSNEISFKISVAIRTDDKTALLQASQISVVPFPQSENEGNFLQVVKGVPTWTSLPVYNGEVE